MDRHRRKNAVHIRVLLPDSKESLRHTSSRNFTIHARLNDGIFTFHEQLSPLP